MALPIIPIVVGAWKVVNMAGNVIFFGSIGKKAYNKYKEIKDKDKEKEEEN